MMNALWICHMYIDFRQIEITQMVLRSVCRLVCVWFIQFECVERVVFARLNTSAKLNIYYFVSLSSDTELDATLGFVFKNEKRTRPPKEMRHAFLIAPTLNTHLPTTWNNWCSEYKWRS